MRWRRLADDQIESELGHRVLREDGVYIAFGPAGSAGADDWRRVQQAAEQLTKLGIEVKTDHRAYNTSKSRQCIGTFASGDAARAACEDNEEASR